MDPCLPLLEDRVWKLIAHLIHVRKDASMAILPEEKPHFSTKHIINIQPPTILRNCMLNIIEWR